MLQRYSMFPPEYFESNQQYLRKNITSKIVGKLSVINYLIFTNMINIKCWQIFDVIVWIRFEEWTTYIWNPRRTIIFFTRPTIWNIRFFSLARSECEKLELDTKNELLRLIFTTFLLKKLTIFHVFGEVSPDKLEKKN